MSSGSSSPQNGSGSTLSEANPTGSDEIFDTAEFGLGGAQHGLIEFDFLAGQAQEALNLGLLLYEQITFFPHVPEELLLFLLGW